MPAVDKIENRKITIGEIRNGLRKSIAWYERFKSLSTRFIGDHESIKALKGFTEDLKHLPGANNNKKPINDDLLSTFCFLSLSINDQRFIRIIFQEVMPNRQVGHPGSVAGGRLTEIRAAYQRLPVELRTPENAKLMCEDWLNRGNLIESDTRIAQIINLLPPQAITQKVLASLNSMARSWPTTPHYASTLKFLQTFKNVIQSEQDFLNLRNHSFEHNDFLRCQIFLKKFPKIATLERMNQLRALPARSYNFLYSRYLDRRDDHMFLNYNPAINNENRFEEIIQVLSAIPYDHAEAIRVLDNIFIAGAGTDRDEKFNPSQSTHTASVHRTVTASAIRLKNRYGNLIDTPEKLNNILNEIGKWGETLEPKLGFIDRVKQLFNIKINRLADIKFAEKFYAAQGIKEILSKRDPYVDQKSEVSTHQLIAMLWLGTKDDSTDINFKSEKREPVRNGTKEDAKHRLMLSFYNYKRMYNQDAIGNDNLSKSNRSNICQSGTFNNFMAGQWGTHIDVEIVYVTLAQFAEKMPDIVQKQLTAQLDKLFAEIKTAEDESRFFRLLHDLKGGITKSAWETILLKPVSEFVLTEYALLFDSPNNKDFKAQLESYSYVDISEVIANENYKRKHTEEEKYPDPVEVTYDIRQMESKDDFIQQIKIENNFKEHLEFLSDCAKLQECRTNLNSRFPLLKEKDKAKAISAIWDIHRYIREYQENPQNYSLIDVNLMRSIAHDTVEMVKILNLPPTAKPKKQHEALLKRYQENAKKLPQQYSIGWRLFGAMMMLLGIVCVAMGIVHSVTGVGAAISVPLFILPGIATVGMGHRFFSQEGRREGPRPGVEALVELVSSRKML